eukprot:1061684-Pleurochrysis_carterae.AAC.1
MRASHIHASPATHSTHSCPRYFNVYHRNDPVAYRLEPLLNDDDDEGSDACDNENDAHNDAHDDAHNGGA